MTPQPYTYDYFERFLTKGTSIAPVTSLKDSKELDRCIFLRHDVDFSMQHAARLFSLEQKHNAKATFFFLTSALSYNVRDRKNRMILQDMARKGFEVGLHFDPTLYPDTPDAELTAKLDFEKGILEEIIGQEVVSVSLHNPSIHGNFLEFDTMNNAYSASTFNNNQYLSDSCYDMKGKNLLEFVEKAADKNLQILIHPMHWNHERLTYHEIFDEYTKDIQERIHHYFSVNKVYCQEKEG